MNVFPYYLLRITVQTSVQKTVKECLDLGLDHFFVLTRLSNLIVQARRAIPGPLPARLNKTKYISYDK